MDFLAANLLLPVVGIVVVLFVGWVLPREEALSQSGLAPRIARAWLAAVRYLAPLAMLVFLVTLAIG